MIGGKPVFALIIISCVYFYISSLRTIAPTNFLFKPAGCSDITHTTPQTQFGGSIFFDNIVKTKKSEILNLSCGESPHSYSTLRYFIQVKLYNT